MLCPSVGVSQMKFDGLELFISLKTVGSTLSDAAFGQVPVMLGTVL